MEDLAAIKRYYNSVGGDRQAYLYDYYQGKNNPVDRRIAVSEVKAATHTNVHVDFMGDIVDLKVGYMGQSITTRFNVEDEELAKRVALEFKMFDRLNNEAVMNSESIRWTSISGISHRLLYTEDGILKAKNIPGWSVVYDYTDDPLNATKAYYYFETCDLVGKKVKNCWVYDKTYVTYYEGDTYNKLGESQPHNFTEVPIFPLVNNDQWVGDCDKSVKLMDVYDEVISDASAEVKAMRLAYLKIWGNLYTGKDSEGNPIDVNKWLTQTSSMNFGTTEDGGKAGDADFLEKNMNDTVIENILNRLRTHIFEVSGSIDLKELASVERAYAAKTSLLRLENNAATTERYMRGFLYKQLRLITYWLRVFDEVDVNYTDIDIVFTRTLPKDIASDADSLMVLSQVLALEDALRILGYPDAKTLADNAKAERDDIGI